MLSSIKKLWSQIKTSVTEFISSINTSIGTVSGAEGKFLDWAKENHYEIETLEFSSFLEAGFSYWQVRRGNSCVKTILVDEQKNSKGAYLMTAFGHDMKVRFVPAENIKFKNPVINYNEKIN